MDLEKDPLKSETIRNIGENIMNFMFTRSQQNLTEPMPFGDKEHSGHGRKPTVISNNGTLLISGQPPKWEGNRIVFRYTAPWAGWVEFGTPPHPINPEVLISWIRRKLRITGKKGINVAWAISQKIKKQGIEPHPYIRPAINSGIVKYNLRGNLIS